MPQTTIVMPCYNEEQRLDRRAIQRFLSTHRGCRLLFVNDGSRDGTLAVLRQIEAERPADVDVLDLPHNAGKAEAVRRGVQYALAHGADYVGFWDADLATPLDLVGDFVRVLDRRRGVDVVLGCRMPLLGHCVHRRPLRGLLGRAFSTTASVLLGLRIRDTQCGAKLFRATPWITAAFSQPFRARWIFDVEILARLVRLSRTAGAPHPGECLYELPLDDWTEAPGSNLRVTDFLKAPFELAGISWRELGPFPAPLPVTGPPPRTRISIAVERSGDDDAQTAPSADDARRAA